MIAWLVAAALIGAAPPPAPPQPAPAPPLDEALRCRATRLADDVEGSEWTYECEGLRAKVSDSTRLVKPEQAASASMGFARAILGDEGTVSLERGRLGGRDAEIVRAHSSEVRAAVAAIVPFPEGTREVACIGVDGTRCGRVLDALAGGPWRSMAPGAIAVAPPELRLGGAPPRIPPGCSPRLGTGNGGIVCDAGRATWSEVPDVETAQRAADVFRAQVLALVDPPAPAPQRVACRIAGIEGACQRVVARSPDPDRPAAGPQRLFAVWGWAATQGGATFALCLARGPKRVPAPCASVFELR